MISRLIGAGRFTALLFLAMTAAAFLSTAIVSGGLFQGGRSLQGSPAGNAPKPPTGYFLRRFGLFSHARPLGSLARLPPGLVSFDSNGATSLVDYEYAREVMPPVGPADWVVPGGGEVCLFNIDRALWHGGGVSGCQTEREGLEGRLFGLYRGLNGTEIVSGLVPDGVPSVTIDLTHGASVGVAVSNNFYQYVGRGIAGVSLTGATRLHLMMPSSRPPKRGRPSFPS